MRSAVTRCTMNAHTGLWVCTNKTWAPVQCMLIQIFEYAPTKHEQLYNACSYMSLSMHQQNMSNCSTLWRWRSRRHTSYFATTNHIIHWFPARSQTSMQGCRLNIHAYVHAYIHACIYTYILTYILTYWHAHIPHGIIQRDELTEWIWHLRAPHVQVCPCKYRTTEYKYLH